LETIFNPKSVAIVGASEVPGKASERRTRSLLEGGFQGKIFPINPKRDRIFGLPAYPSVAEVPEEVDLVMIVIPPRFIPEAVAQSVQKGAKGIVIITAGLGETGEEGKKIEAEILRIASEGGARVIGPNCSGLFSASAKMNLLGVPPIKPGPFCILAQSGNIIDSLTHYGRLRGVGFSKIISAGNAIGLQFHEYIEYLGEDPDTRVILLYLEGIKEGGRLVEVARQVSQRKPIVAIKVGRTKAGARAAASHTGALAGDDQVVDAALKQAGVIRVANVDELFDVGLCFAEMPLPKGRRVAIFSEGGGDNSIAADNAERAGLEVPLLPPEAQEKIKPHLLQGMPAHNPIDYGGTAEENPEVIVRVVEALMEEETVDCLYMTGFFGGFKEIIAPHVAELEEKAARELVRLVREAGKPLVVHTSFANEPIKALEILREGGIFVTPSSERAAQGLAQMVRFFLRREELKGARPVEVTGIDSERARRIVEGVKASGRRNLLETEARELLEAYGVKMPPAVLAGSPEEAAEAASVMGFPAVLKVVSPQILHKSEVGGVKLDLKGEEEVKDAFGEIVKRAREVSSEVLGVLVTPMAPRGQECIVGLVRDRQFGPVVMFGLGGVFVEVLKDVSFRVVPLTDLDLEEMVREIRGYSVLEGIRGELPKDVGALKDIIARVAQIGLDLPEVKELDLNPVIVHERGASIVDARAIVA